MKPNDVFLGVLELFSVLMPGFLVVKVGAHFAGMEKLSSPSTADWILVTIASYIVGHICYAIGSHWDELYDKTAPRKAKLWFDQVDRVREEVGHRNCELIRGYKWCQTVLSKVHPDGFADVLRKEADSKLFRSLLIPFLFTTVILLFDKKYDYAVISLGMSVIAFYRYRDKRYKASVAACSYIISLHQLGELSNVDGEPKESQSPLSHARDDKMVMN